MATTADYAVQLTAVVQESPARITLNWTGASIAVNYYEVYRRDPVYSWVKLATLSSMTFSFQDTAVSVGTIYEYRVIRVMNGVFGLGYICSGIKVPAVHSLGKVILVIDLTFATSLALEIQRLQADLVAEGWQVGLRTVGRTAAVTDVKAALLSEYNADPSNVSAAILIGHVPVPYSGNYAPDGHSNHQGAWPADVYYAALGTSVAWTDSTVTSPDVGNTRIRNIPGDGKFDNSFAQPADVKLAVGRIDCANLPVYALSETELLRRYLDKNHSFRTKAFNPQDRGFLFDGTGVYSSGEAFAQNAYRAFPATLAGFTATSTPNTFLPAVTDANGWVWACAYSSGSNNVCHNAISSADCAAAPAINAVFTMLFGSYLGDWDQTNNVMRALLAAPGMVLTCNWGSRPNWFWHSMGMGEPIGWAAVRTQKNVAGLTYYPRGTTYNSWCSLLGDPTLRQQVMAAPTGLSGESDGDDVVLNWASSADATSGYHVYHATSAAGPFTRLTTDPVAGLTYTDPDRDSGNYHYMVRSMKLEVTPSGSFYNLSPGVVAVVNHSAPPNTAPLLTITSPTNGLTFLTTQNVTLTAAATDAEDGNVSANVSWSSDLDGALGTGASIQVALSAGVHTITASVADADAATVTAQVALTVRLPNQAPTLTILSPSNGAEFELTAGLSASASDPEDGDLSASISWASDVSGVLGTGSSLTVDLPMGTHIISATVTDSEGATDSESVTITIGNSSIPPALDPIYNVGIAVGDTATVELHATYEDTDLLDWNVSHDNEGLIASLALSGTGGTRSLLITPHPDQGGSATVTVKVTQEDGLFVSTSFLLMVTAPPPPELYLYPRRRLDQPSSRSLGEMRGIHLGGHSRVLQVASGLATKEHR